MPWKERVVSQMREEFVKRALEQEKSKSALCREYGISRPTGDKWIGRYVRGECLDDRSRRPFHTANRVAEAVEQSIVEYRQSHPAIGALKIRRILETKGRKDMPSVKTVNNILKRNGLITPEASRAATASTRFEKSRPNEMWQADYKGHFALGDGTRCHPLNILDDCSRFNLCCQAQHGETLDEMWPVMLRLFEEYGMPYSFLCDNGNPWGTAQSTGFSRFEVRMMELGILVLHGRSWHPQTQGKEESFNRSLTRELLRYSSFADMADAQRGFNSYREFYNCERPHHALELNTPVSRYMPAIRQLPGSIALWEYPEGCDVRRVKQTGFFNYNGQGYFLSEAFGGKDIAVRKSKIPNCISLFFRQFRIGRIDVDKRVFTFKRAYLIDNDPRFSTP